MEVKKKPGPTAQTRSAGTVRTSLMLAPDMVEWGKSQPGGLSALVRRLITQERQRQGKSRKEEAK